MRTPQSPDKTPQPYNAALCRSTRRMRDRMEAALDRIDRLELELAAERAAIAEERAAFLEQLESPEAERDILLIAQSLLQSEVIDALAGPDQRAVCATCGGLGHGLTKGLLAARISDHCQRHGLNDEGTPLSEARWPRVTTGYGRDFGWHKPKETSRYGGGSAHW